MTDFAVGDLVKFVHGSSKFILEDINPNEDYVADEETWATGSTSDGYNNVDVWAKGDIELVMSAADAAKRKPPTPVELEDWLSGCVHRGMNGPIDVYESEVQGDGSVVVQATAENGMDISFLVRIDSVYVN